MRQKGIAITFWRPDKENGWLSNFYDAELRIGAEIFPTSEHYYQAMKHEGTQLFSEIAYAKTPAYAKQIARSKDSPISEHRKIENMRTAIEAKFTQHSFLRYALLGTGNTQLIESSTKDAYWGWGENGSGINMMGLLLMELRAKLA